MRIALAFVFLVGALLASTRASAHPTPGSFAFVDFSLDHARLEQDVPIEELQRAMKRDLYVGSAALSVIQHETELRAYARDHVRADGWTATVDEVRGHESDDGPRARFFITLRAPNDHAALVLHDGLVTDEVVSHYLTVYVRKDWAAGLETGAPRLVGTIHAGRTDLHVPRAGGLGQGLRSMVGAGVEHIATGTDHVVFLLALLLVAPVTGAGWRWTRSSRDALIAVAKVVTAFTVGHSLTLALGAFGLVHLPEALVEAAIALSILMTAAHAIRPIFPRREALVAAAFGLVHGLAFAQTLADRDVGASQIAWTLLGFNLGIELAQITIIALVLPWLLVLAGTGLHRPARIAGAVVIGLFAAGWLLERTTTLANPLSGPLAWLEAHPLLPLAALAGGALLARQTRRIAVARPPGHERA